ncbi:MAG: hypothetical protein ABFQ65_03875 [Nanoarchaeota archaeon]
MRSCLTKILLFTVPFIFSGSAEASLNYNNDTVKISQRKNMFYETQSLPYCNNLFRTLNEDEKYKFLINVLVGLDLGDLSLEEVKGNYCKLRGNIVNIDFPMKYSFEELYNLFFKDYVKSWLSENR